MRRIDDLERNGFKIIQETDSFCFGIDSVLLADFIKENKKAKVIDLGTGNGIIPLLLIARDKIETAVGIEIQKANVELVKENIELNNIEEKFKVVEADIKNISDMYKTDKFDIVVTNPPYMKVGTGKVNINESKLIARHEVMCKLKDVIRNSSKILKEYGYFYMVNRVDRFNESITLMNEYKINPTRIKFIKPDKNKKANLFLIEGRKLSKENLVIEHDLEVYKDNGEYTEEIMAIYYN
ncbi:MAG: tRNA1(Val) (adenine(37)-N6)-methyltransferase [Clostridia bacterium]|jgi:tRNA1(Val) A37 N6-methylase TrmN6|nr:tRNA1(Val) (adenine(37)-N6)-methyltransferase [Clostridia bacterium]